MALRRDSVAILTTVYRRYSYVDNIVTGFMAGCSKLSSYILVVQRVILLLAPC